MSLISILSIRYELAKNLCKIIAATGDAPMPMEDYLSMKNGILQNMEDALQQTEESFKAHRKNKSIQQKDEADYKKQWELYVQQINLIREGILSISLA